MLDFSGLHARKSWSRASTKAGLRTPDRLTRRARGREPSLKVRISLHRGVTLESLAAVPQRNDWLSAAAYSMAGAVVANNPGQLTERLHISRSPSPCPNVPGSRGIP